MTLLNVQPRCGLGLSRLGSVGESKKDGVALIRSALDEGIRLFDTADIYGQGDSEVTLAGALGDRRSEVLICSKGGYRFSAGLSRMARAKRVIKPLIGPLLSRFKRAQNLAHSVRARGMQQDFSADYLLQALEGSLTRLRTDYLDVFYLHSPPPDLCLHPEYQSTLQRIRASGMAHRVGVACRTTSEGAAFLAAGGVDVLQIPLSLDTVADFGWRAEAARAGVCVVVREAIGSLAQLRSRPLLNDLAKKLGQNEFATAMQFPLQMESVSAVVFSTKNPTNLRANAAATHAASWPKKVLEEALAI